MAAGETSATVVGAVVVGLGASVVVVASAVVTGLVAEGVGAPTTAVGRPDEVQPAARRASETNAGTAPRQDMLLG